MLIGKKKVKTHFRISTFRLQQVLNKQGKIGEAVTYQVIGRFIKQYYVWFLERYFCKCNPAFLSP